MPGSQPARNTIYLKLPVYTMVYNGPTSIKYLGVISNNNLTWSDHVTYITQKQIMSERDLKQCVPSVRLNVMNHIFLTHFKILFHYVGPSYISG